MGMVGLMSALSMNATAAPRVVEPFDNARWAALKADIKRPTAVVFTTTDCAHCPAVIKALASDARVTRAKGGLVAVVMDVAPGEADAALLKNAHYKPVDQLMAFSGQAPALRHAVNPTWRGVTPYIALLRPGEPPLWVVGPPTRTDIDAWMAPAAPTSPASMPALAPASTPSRKLP
jgi:thiol-disulfide isomerase/thioredoxin